MFNLLQRLHDSLKRTQIFSKIYLLVSTVKEIKLKPLKDVTME